MTAAPDAAPQEVPAAGAAGMPAAQGSAPRQESAKRFAADAARLLAATRCHNVAVLDVSGLSPVTDFLVLATGTSPRQMKSVCDQVEELGEGQDYRPLSRAGDDGASWVVMDFIDVVVHVFSQDARLFYDLDNLWGDARRVEWQDATAPAGGTGGDALQERNRVVEEN